MICTARVGFRVGVVLILAVATQVGPALSQSSSSPGNNAIAAGSVVSPAGVDTLAGGNKGASPETTPGTADNAVSQPRSDNGAGGSDSRGSPRSPLYPDSAAPSLYDAILEQRASRKVDDGAVDATDSVAEE